MNNSETTAETKKPGIGYYLLGIGIIVLGLVALLAFTIFGMESGIQIVVPGNKEITLGKEGGYEIFYEYQSIVDNKVYSTDKTMPPIQVNLKCKATGQEIGMRPISDTDIYTISYGSKDRKGCAIWYFNIEQKGIYEFSAFYTDGAKSPEIVLNILNSCENRFNNQY